MKHTLSTGIGSAFLIFGLILLYAASRLIDLDYAANEFVPYIEAGFVSMIGGLLITKI